MEMNIEVVAPPIQHGEGPFWNHKNKSLYFLDTFQPTVLKWDSFSKNITTHQLNGDSVGFLVPVKKMIDTFMLCRDREVCLFTWDGACNNTGVLQTLLRVDEDQPYNQFNDGKADARGRLWGGTLTRNKDLTVANDGGSLYCITSNPELHIDIKISPVSISNGLAWSGDQKSFFYIDSVTRKIMKYSFNLSRGHISKPKILLDMDSYPNLKGIPDGMTVDTEDNLWVALYGGKAVIKVDSKTGKLLLVIEMPVTYVTSVTFGGANFKTLFATTSRLNLSPNELLNEPTAGSVFAINNLGVRGYPPDQFIFQSKPQ